MTVAPVSPETATGVDELVIVPLPSCPVAFHPQHCTVPPAISAHADSVPTETAMALVMLPTAIGAMEHGAGGLAQTPPSPVSGQQVSGPVVVPLQSSP